MNEISRSALNFSNPNQVRQLRLPIEGRPVYYFKRKPHIFFGFIPLHSYGESG